MIIYATLFLFLGSFFFFMYPTVKRQLYAMQQGGYYYEKFIAFMKTERKVESMWVLAAFIFSSYLLQRFLSLPLYLLVHTLALTVLGLLHLKKPKEPAPCFDARMIRLCAASAFLFLCLFLLLGVLFKRSFFWEMPFVLMFLGFMTDTWILLANFIVSPFEKRRGKAAGNAAEKRINEIDAARAAAGKPKLIKIGVAGSYGKSGLAAAAKHLLSEKYNVLSTEGGEAGSLSAAGRVVEHGLTGETDVLILEIAARHPGDVKAFCNSIPVDAGAVTAISERNMETFLSIERVAETQMELPAAIARAAQGGKSLCMNFDDEQVRKQKCNDLPVLRYGIYRGDGNPQHLDLYARDVEYFFDHTAFTLKARALGEVRCTVPQPGKYALLAAVGAAAMALSRGMTLEEIEKRLNALPPLPGYLAAIPDGAWPDAARKKLAKPWETDGAETRGNAPFRFLDDPGAFSLESAKDSVAMLGTFPGYRILLTAGMRDQGQNADEANRQLGRSAARHADDVIVVGKGAFSVVEDGAKRAGYHMDNMHLAADFKDAYQRTKSLAAEGAKPGESVCVLMLGRFV